MARVGTSAEAVAVELKHASAAVRSNRSDGRPDVADAEAEAEAEAEAALLEDAAGDTTTCGAGAKFNRFRLRLCSTTARSYASAALRSSSK